MRTVTFLGICAFLSLCAGSSRADAPDLEKGAYLLDGAKLLEADRHSNPFVADWNNDGAKDLLVGQFTSGYIWLYLNMGTDLNPVFNGGEKVKSNGTPITTTYG